MSLRMILFEIVNLKLFEFSIIFLLTFLNIGCGSEDKKEEKHNGYYSEAYGSKDDAEVFLLDNISPRLIDFRIESKFPYRLYFNSSEVIRGTSANGFIVANKVIVDIKLNQGELTDHYFVLEEPLTYWDNLTIRYIGGSDLKDSEGKGIYPFSIRYVRNDLFEPKSNKYNYFISVTGNDLNDGLSEESSWRTITKAGKSVKAGSTVWIKAGDYGDENISIKASGTITDPIKFIGYKYKPGDASKLKRKQDLNFNEKEMPLIQSSNLLGIGLITNHDYIIIRNFQVIGYESSIHFGKSNHTILDNVYVKNGKKYNINGFNYHGFQNRIINSYVSNSQSCGIRMAGSSHLIQNVYACSSGSPNMDYYISIYGGLIGVGNHIIRNCIVKRDPDDSHSGHGISVKSKGKDLHYTLIENCEIEEVSQAIELRHSQVKYSIVRNVIATSAKGNKTVSNLITFRDGTSFNTVENCISKGINTGVKFTMNIKEDKGQQDGGHHNRVKNSVFINTKVIISVKGINGTALQSHDNEFINCTFYSAQNLYRLDTDFPSSNRFINCIFSNIKNEVLRNGKSYANYEFSNFYKCDDWSKKYLKVNNNISADPLFKDESRGDFNLTPKTPVIISRGGVTISDIYYDIKDKERLPQFSIGAFQL